MVQPLNRNTINQAIKNMQIFVQQEKVDVSRRTIRNLQASDRFSQTYTAYHSSLSAANRYNDPERFFRVMPTKPSLWRRKFFYIGDREGASRIGEAAHYVMKLLDTKSRQYGIKTGFYRRSFEYYLDGSPFTNRARLQFTDPDSVFMAINTAAYASTVEAISLYSENNRTGGVLYYAAKMALRRFPELGVKYSYQKAAIGLNHKYDIPTLEIGSRENVFSEIVRPGSRFRGRKRLKRHAARINARFK